MLPAYFLVVYNLCRLPQMFIIVLRWPCAYLSLTL